MLVFSTRIPLKETTTRDDFLDVCIRWVVGSPRYVTEGLIYNALNQEDYDYSNDNITFSIRNYKDQKVEISACRLENREPNVIWTNDCIFLSEENSKSVLIQLNCTRKDFNTKLPLFISRISSECLRKANYVEWIMVFQSAIFQLKYLKKIMIYVLESWKEHTRILCQLFI